MFVFFKSQQSDLQQNQSTFCRKYLNQLFLRPVNSSQNETIKDKKQELELDLAVTVSGVVKMGGGESEVHLIHEMFETRYIINQTAMNSKKNLPQANKFVSKIVAMMKDFPSVINWSEDGMELQIYNVQVFIKEVHPFYFTGSNYKSFLRQLNMYSFSKMSKRKNSINFSHPQFSRGQEHLFQLIKRRKQHNKDIKLSPDLVDLQELPSKKSTIQHQNTEANIAEEIKQLLSKVKSALHGRGVDAFIRLQNHITKLQELNQPEENQNIKSKQSHMSKEFLSMHKIQRLAESNKEAFTQSDLQYNLEQSIFNEGKH